jgi:ATP-dependent Clp protease ATP-binding subunit ClpX
MAQGKDVVPGRRSVGGTGSGSNRRNAFCSFCRKSYREVGPLVEGPGDVYICGECIELCQSILDQENKRKPQKKLFSDIPTPVISSLT